MVECVVIILTHSKPNTGLGNKKELLAKQNKKESVYITWFVFSTRVSS